ncbi:hypothetical protein H5410_031949 [Solanum commersonii]|uniref:Uncharacterized protein n=1 Tax=Solanum commersonii TaxID=4109 RepID=A0A9J5YIL3_SOLCO|nr:hypothetical protein H5410_031949 [Solanum commersonii]
MKALAVDPVDRDSQNGLFSRSNNLRSSLFFHIFTWASVKILVMEPVDHHGQNDPFSRTNEPYSR